MKGHGLASSVPDHDLCLLSASLVSIVNYDKMIKGNQLRKEARLTIRPKEYLQVKALSLLPSRAKRDQWLPYIGIYRATEGLVAPHRHSKRCCGVAGHGEASSKINGSNASLPNARPLVITLRKSFPTTHGHSLMSQQQSGSHSLVSASSYCPPFLFQSSHQSQTLKRSSFTSGSAGDDD